MAIKPISKLDPYNNGATDTAGCVGGNVHLYDIPSEYDKLPKLNDPQSYKEDSSYKDQVVIGFDENDFYNLLFEVSKPIDPGKEGLNSNEYSSYKITYEDLIQNIIVDTKQWLNARNNLGDFDLCAIVNRSYAFTGDKTFIGNVDINQTLDVVGATNITGDVSITGNTRLKNNLYVERNISCGDNLSVRNNIYARGALYTGTLSSDPDGTIIDPGKNGFIVQGVLLGKADPDGYLSIQVPTNINNTLHVTGGITGDGGITVTGDSVFNNNVNISGDLKVDGIADLTAERAKWSDLAEYYLGDKKYEPGTLVKFGGKNEVTIADCSTGEVNGVVTSKPAFLMNSGLKDNPLGCAIALAGRVPVKVIGKVKKFDLITLSEFEGIGIAISKEDLKWRNAEVIGRTLESNGNEDVKLVECVVKFEI